MADYVMKLDAGFVILFGMGVMAYAVWRILNRDRSYVFYSLLAMIGAMIVVMVAMVAPSDAQYYMQPSPQDAPDTMADEWQWNHMNDQGRRNTQRLINGLEQGEQDMYEQQQNNDSGCASCTYGTRDWAVRRAEERNEYYQRGGRF